MSPNYGSLRRRGPDSPRLRTQRINKGIYQYSYDGRMVEWSKSYTSPEKSKRGFGWHGSPSSTANTTRTTLPNARR